ncbi:hypothetical protein Tco_1340423 [Tanacetum coccineum]
MRRCVWWFVLWNSGEPVVDLGAGQAKVSVGIGMRSWVMDDGHLWCLPRKSLAGTLSSGLLVVVAALPDDGQNLRWEWREYEGGDEGDGCISVLCVMCVVREWNEKI